MAKPNGIQLRSYSDCLPTDVVEYGVVVVDRRLKTTVALE
jgi:hypothetical protein